MTLVLGAITPHPPLILAPIGKEKARDLKKTAKAFQLLEEDFYAAQPETVLILSPHGPFSPDAFSLNLAQHYISDMTEFGDISTKLRFDADFDLLTRLRDCARTSHIPVHFAHQENIDYGAAIPLSFLLPHLPKTKIIPIHYSSLDYVTHFEFGRVLQQEILNSSKRIAVIASGDLSHRLSEDSPAGFSPRAKIFDQKVIEGLSSLDHAKLLKIDPELVTEAHECGLRAFLILLGIFNSVNARFEQLSYEHPFGIGYLLGKITPQ